MEATKSSSTTQVLLQPSDLQPDVTACITQQSVVQITLAGPSLILTIIAIITSIQILRPSLTCTLLAIATVALIVYNDYFNFLSLGPGGTPSTFLGYLKITCLRLFALSDPYSPATFTESLWPESGLYLATAPSWLPMRQGPRPKIAGIAPQRQLDQRGCKRSYQMLRTSLENLALRNPESFRVATSCFEKKGLALFARNPVNATCRGEVCHVHHSDRSLHLNLHPDDAKVVLENGWGERHPLARGGWMKTYVPREFVMIYAPRDRMELEVVCRIIEAASFWVSGKQFEVTVEGHPCPETPQPKRKMTL